MNALVVLLLLAIPTAAASKDAPATKTSSPNAAAAAAAVQAIPAAGAAASKGGAATSPKPQSASVSAVAKPDPSSPAPRKLVPPPPKGSHVAPDNNMCFQCHTNAGQWDEKDPKSWRLYIPEKNLQEDVHWQKGVNCHDCHGGNHDTDKLNVAHATEDGFRAKPEIARCAECHKEQSVELRKGVHDKAGPKAEDGSGTILACDNCHGSVAHHLLPSHDKRSPVFLDNQIQTCGKCHEKELATYTDSVHGQGLYKLGLLVTAACANCHGAHGIYRARDRRSSLFEGNVAGTCGKCHRFIAERLQKSVHGRGTGPGEQAERVAPGGKTRERPSCTSCHQGHEISLTASTRFRSRLPNLCGNCHAGLSGRYEMSIHGQLTDLGYGPAAECSDCHGSHDILPVNDPGSLLFAQHRQETCRKCHPYAAGNLISFDPHADQNSRVTSPILYWVYRALLTLLFSVFGFFGAHSVLWFVRSLVEVLKRGRPKGLRPGAIAYVRFVPFHRAAHVVLLVSFLGLALTGLPLKYSGHEWAKSVAHALGGFGSTSVWHRVFALTTFGCFVTYLVVMFRVLRAGRKRGDSWTGMVFGPDSPMPNWRDVKDFAKMLRWFVGLGPKPSFDRWTYWEKFDFWGAIGDVVIIGSTGLILWFPNFFCSFLPGVTLNIAKVVHSTQALLATGFVFAIHFFNTHFRPDKFPADMSVLTGLVSEAEFKDERPDYFERMRREGKLDQMATTTPSRRRLWSVRLWGFIALAVGLGLLAALVWTGLGE